MPDRVIGPCVVCGFPRASGPRRSAVRCSACFAESRQSPPSPAAAAVRTHWQLTQHPAIVFETGQPWGTGYACRTCQILLYADAPPYVAAGADSPHRHRFETPEPEILTRIAKQVERLRAKHQPKRRRA